MVGKSILEKHGKSDANEAVLHELRARKALLHQENYHHSYPHCWRSKTPVIFRAMDQWFIKIDHGTEEFKQALPNARVQHLQENGQVIEKHEVWLRTRAVHAINHEVKWIPDWGQNRIFGAVASRPDWCISRQRTWGVPIPAFYDAKGEPILDAQIVRNAADLIEKHGSNVWFEKSAAELWSLVKPKDWKGAEAVNKSNDTLDVWIDSGSSSRSVLMRRAEVASLNSQLSTLNQRLASRRLPRRLRPASRLVSILAAALARRQWRRAVQDRAHPWIHGGRGPREDFQEQTGPGRLRKTADRRGLRQKIRRGHRAPVGRVAGLPQRHRRERGTHRQGQRNLSRHPQRAALPALEPVRLRSGKAHRGR